MSAPRPSMQTTSSPSSSSKLSAIKLPTTQIMSAIVRAGSRTAELTLPDKRVEESWLEQVGQVHRGRVVESASLSHHLFELYWQGAALSIFAGDRRIQLSTAEEVG